MHVLSVTAALWVGFLPAELLVATQDERKAPVPDLTAQNEAEELIHDMFKEEYGKKSKEDQQLLAKKLLEESTGSVGGRATQYVLLREAREIAARAGDAATAFRAIDEMAKSFEIDSRPMKMSALSKAAQKAKSPPEMRRLTSLYGMLAEDARSADDYHTASRAASAALKYAKRLKDVWLIAQAMTRAKHFSRLKILFEAVKEAKTKLAENPDDGAANRVVGRFLCMAKAQWSKGLPLLAKCDDGSLSRPAANDMEQPADASGKAAVGNGWWDVATQEKGFERRAVLHRAAYWYKQAEGGLSGLAKLKVEKRLQKIRWDVSDGGWENYTNPSLFGRLGGPGESMRLSAKRRDATTVWLRRFPAGAFDGVSVRIRFGSKRPTQAAIVVEKDVRAFGITSRDHQIYSKRGGGSMWVREDQKKVPKLDEYVLTILLVDGAYVASVNGKEKMRVKTEAKAIHHLGIEVESGGATFEQVRLRLKN